MAGPLLMSSVLCCAVCIRGYCTREEKAEAAHTPGIRVIGLSQFCELLRFGLLMGVDDGCEPTPEEVQAGLE